MIEWAYRKHFASAIIDNITGKAMKYRNLIKSEKHRVIWEQSLANEFERLAQGICDIKGPYTITFIPRDRKKLR